MRINDLRRAAKMENLDVVTDLGEIPEVSVISGKLMVSNPVKIRKDDLLDFIDLSEMEAFTEGEIECVVALLKEKGK